MLKDEMPFNCVRIVSDFLATRPSEQASNLRWLKEHLRDPLARALGNGTRIELGIDPAFAQDQFLNAASAQGRKGDIHRWFDASALKGKATRILRDAIAPETLLISYELSKPTREALDACAIPWIDIWLHPVRFHSDILFAMRSSDPGINERLAAHALPDQALFTAAKEIYKNTRHGDGAHHKNLIDGAFLFAGQLPRDKSVLRNGRFQRLEYHAAAFEAIALSVPHIYYLDHPKLARQDPDTNLFLAGFPNVSRLDAPTYALLADPRVSGVVSLSSSLCEEARFFHKEGRRILSPTIPLSGDGTYVGTFQKIGDVEFWKDILSDRLNVVQRGETKSRSASEPLRDKIGFHWSEQELPKGTLDDPHSTLRSFDLFDTLITRRYARPDHVFVAISDKAAPLLGIAPDTFRAARQTAERKAKQIANSKARDEPRIEDIYRAMEPSPDENTVRALVELEFDEELACAEALPEGFRLFADAKASGETIVVISDTPYSADHCARLLDKAGYSGWTEIFTSADYGKTKLAGGLYEDVLNQLKSAPNSVLHLGDNYQSDVTNARSLGLTADHIPVLTDQVRHWVPTLGPAINRLESSSVTSGLLVKSAAIAVAEHANAASPAWRFGALCLGPLLTGFALWLHSNAQRDGVERLGFLTREGEVMRRCFDTLFPEFETCDVVASRQIANRAAAVEPVGFTDLSNRTSSGETVAEWCLRTSGLSPDPTKLAACGILDTNAIVGTEVPRQNLQAFAAEVMDDALQSNMKLATDYTAYLQSLKIGPENSAIVDIGYRGTMQSSIEDLLGKGVHAYYLASAQMEREHEARGYLTEQFDRRGKSQIERNRTIYETVLCAAGSTFTGIAQVDGEWIGRRDLRGDKPRRAQFVKLAHEGAVAMAEAFRKATPDPSAIQVSPEIADLAMSSLLASPDQAHAKLIGMLDFDDPNAGAVPTPLADPHQSESPLWQEGARVLGQVSKPSSGVLHKRRGPAWTWRGAYGVFGWRHLMTPFVAMAIGWIGQRHDVDHFRDDPIGFFRRLNDPRYRRIGRWLYPKD